MARLTGCGLRVDRGTVIIFVRAGRATRATPHHKQNRKKSYEAKHRRSLTLFGTRDAGGTSANTGAGCAVASYGRDQSHQQSQAGEQAHNTLKEKRLEQVPGRRDPPAGARRIYRLLLLVSRVTPLPLTPTVVVPPQPTTVLVTNAKSARAMIFFTETPERISRGTITTIDYILLVGLVVVTTVDLVVFGAVVPLQPTTVLATNATRTRATIFFMGNSKCKA